MKCILFEDRFGSLGGLLGDFWGCLGAPCRCLAAFWAKRFEKGRPRAAQESPKEHWIGQKSSPREAQQGQEGPRETPRSPREAQEAPKGGPKDSQRVRRSPRKHPRQAKKASRKQKYKKAAQHSSTKEPLSIEWPRRGSRSAYNYMAISPWF